MTTRAALVAGAIGLLVVVSVSACTASSSPSGPSTPAPSTADTPSAPEVTGTPPIATSPSTPVPTSSASSTTPTSSAPTTSAPVSSSPTSAPTSAPVPARSSCTKLTIRVLLGSGAPGYEFAALQFVNDDTSACTLVGVPTVTLLRNGALTGTVSQPSSDRARFRTYRLAPGAAAESKLKDFSSCNAPLSQSIRVIAPGSTITSTRPGVLRACKLVVYPLGKPE